MSPHQLAGTGAGVRLTRRPDDSPVLLGRVGSADGVPAAAVELVLAPVAVVARHMRGHARRCLQSAFAAADCAGELSSATGESRATLQADVDLVLTELVSNAVVHAGTLLRVRIECIPTSRGECTDSHGHGHGHGTRWQVRISVSDGSAVSPRCPDRQEWSTGGRGWQMVRALSSDCGVRPDPVGKTVWCVIDG